MTTNMCNPDKILNYFCLKEILKITREYLIIKKKIDSRQKKVTNKSISIEDYRL